NGDKESGVTTFFLKRKVDTGNIIAQKKTPVLDEDNLHSLYDKLRYLGADLVIDTLNLIANEEISENEQDDSLACPAPKVTSETQLLNFEESSIQCHNRVRAFAPKPGAFTFREKSRIKILATRSVDGHGTPGQVIEVSSNSFSIACGTGALAIDKVQ
ncbi:MAG: methionyl-tRNA formyltransferase, partial [Proteobacteria bacterium]|nr:methionyl-tRNA formyltransferase [Pseudomonadota bacterium]